MIDIKLKQFATARQLEYLEAVIKHGSNQKAAKALGIDRRVVDKGVKAVKEKAEKRGYAPEYGLTHEPAPGFTTKRVSTAYREDGTVALQWHIQEKEKEELDQILSAFREGLQSELVGLHKSVRRPAKCDEKLMSCYIIGDHHLGMYAWSDETGGDDYDCEIAESLMDSAIDRLVTISPPAKNGLLLNVGDLFHANDTTSLTPASKNLLDSDGRFGRVIRIAGRMFKRLIYRMLQKHDTVTVINARGNHDPDAALWLNEMIALYFDGDKRVRVLDNYNKFVHLTFGNNLIVSHHGDKIKPQKIYEAVTRNLRNEWGACEYAYCWTGHIHHKEAEEIGGMLFESWNVLPPPDAWHAASGYGADRSMSCVVLHEDYGEECRFKVGIKRLKESA